MANLIEARNLGQEFASGGKAQVIFQNLQVQVQQGEFVTLLGPSGCGKSTLLRLLGGLLKPSRGEVKSLALRSSFVFQEPRLLPWRNCLENTLLPQELAPADLSPEAALEKARSLLSLVGLSGALEKFPHQLSGGMKMRNALARSLMVDPELLLMDEPFSALDESTRGFLQIEIRSLFESQPRTVVFVTHSIEEAVYLSDRILIFSQSRSSLNEIKSALPKTRTPSLRDSLEYFEEVKKVRRAFEQEARL